MRLNGAHQTTFADWSKLLFSTHPNDITFQLDPTGEIVNIFSGDEIVGFYDFSQGAGEVTGQRGDMDIYKMGKWEAFKEINADIFLH